MNDKPSFATKLLAISGTLALIIFMVLGFAFGAWAWAWVVFLVPGLIRTWQGVGQGETDPAKASPEVEGARSTTATPGAAPPNSATHEPSHVGEEPAKEMPPPQRYEG